MQLFKTMADANPDLFVHVGDTIYADGPLRRGSDAGRRHGLEEHRHAGEIESRRNARRVSRQSPLQPPRRALPAVSIGGRADRDVGRPRSPRQLVSPQVLPEDGAAIPKSASRCSPARARQAFLEQYPVTMARRADARIYRSIPVGPLVEVFALDMRSYRGANNENLQTVVERGQRDPRSRTGALARGCAHAIDGDVENRRRRHAARHRRRASARTA